MTKKQKVIEILMKILRFNWDDGRYNAKNVGSMVQAWADEIIKLFEKE